VSFSLLAVAQEAGAGYELAFFDGLEKRISALVNAGADSCCSAISSVRETSSRDENLDAHLRHVARGNYLFRAGAVELHARAAASALFHALKMDRVPPRGRSMFWVGTLSEASTSWL